MMNDLGDSFYHAWKAGIWAQQRTREVFNIYKKFITLPSDGNDYKLKIIDVTYESVIIQFLYEKSVSYSTPKYDSDGFSYDEIEYETDTFTKEYTLPYKWFEIWNDQTLNNTIKQYVTEKSEEQIKNEKINKIFALETEIKKLKGEL